MVNVIKIYTDGACNKKGRGGAAAIMLGENIESGNVVFKNNTTNNQMELLAAILGCSIIEDLTEEELDFGSSFEIITDSQYVQKGITQWIHNWKKNNWINSEKKPVKNKDIWIIFDNVRKRLIERGIVVNFTWVKGHNNNLGNEIVDILATQCYEDEPFDIDKLNKSLNRVTRSDTNIFHEDVFNNMYLVDLCDELIEDIVE